VNVKIQLFFFLAFLLFVQSFFAGFVSSTIVKCCCFCLDFAFWVREAEARIFRFTSSLVVYMVKELEYHDHSKSLVRVSFCRFQRLGLTFIVHFLLLMHGCYLLVYFTVGAAGSFSRFTFFYALWMTFHHIAIYIMHTPYCYYSTHHGSALLYRLHCFVVSCENFTFVFSDDAFCWCVIADSLIPESVFFLPFGFFHSFRNVCASV
jgi:hypothetical protein